MQSSASLSLINLIFKSDLIIKCVVATLLTASFLVWAILFEKIVKMRILTTKSNAFEKKFWSGIMLEEFYDKYRSKFNHPMGQIFAAGMQEWMSSETNSSIAQIELIKTGLRERISTALEIATIKIENQVSSHMEFLGTVASLSPFIGLFGTVWGIINSFRAIAGAGNVGLHVVAPGIAEALVTTAIGIFVAVLSLLFHAILRTSINAFLDRVDSFKLDIMSILSRELDMFSVRKA